MGSVAGMDGRQMHRLGKRLVQLAAAVTGAPGEIRLTLGDAAVLEEVLEDPSISIKEIHERTGFSQGHVSASVARLRERRLLETAPDGGSAWRSNTRAQASDYALQTISRHQARPVDEAVVRAVGDPSQARRAIRLMAELADILL
jgi:DNA-binding MarR family transcriptional regulator